MVCFSGIATNYSAIYLKTGDQLRERHDFVYDSSSTLLDACLAVADWAEPHFSYRPLLDDPGDEMVLEAATNGGADIVTFNRKHFLPAERFGVGVRRPAEVLQFLFERSTNYGAI